MTDLTDPHFGVTARISVGTPTDIEFSTHGSPADGGRISASIPILVDNHLYACALVGAFVYTDTQSAGEREAAQVRRLGFAIVPYSDAQRCLEYAPDSDLDLEDLVPGTSNPEQILLDAAERMANIDYEAIFVNALRDRLVGKSHEFTVALINAVRALDRESHGFGDSGPERWLPPTDDS